MSAPIAWYESRPSAMMYDELVDVLADSLFEMIEARARESASPKGAVRR
jgi:hypothetical protein